MTDYTAVLQANYLGSEWVLYGNDYDTLEWFSDTPKPTQSQLDAEWQALTAEVEAQAAAAAQAAADKAAAAASGRAKLAALGLTNAEIAALLGA